MSSVKKIKIKKLNVTLRRIHRSLSKIEELILENMQENCEDFSQMDDSHILELAVKYIRKYNHSSFAEYFLRGYVNATNEVSFALSHLSQINESTRNQIIARLENLNQLLYYKLLNPSSPGYASGYEVSGVWRPW